MSFAKYFLFLSCAALICACTATISSDDEDEISSVSSSSGKKSSSSKTSDKKSSAVEKDKSSSSGELDEDCVGELGIPWDGTTAKDFACGAGTKLSPYVILTAEQLAKLSFIVGSNDKDYQGKYYKLGADIILNDGKIIDEKGALVADSTKLHKWTPIGNSSVAFTGTFDGDGHTVSGMFINTTSSHNGLFGNSSGTVENLTVENSWVNGGKNTAGIVAVLAGAGIVKNVENKASIISQSETVAGIVALTSYAYSKKGTIENAKNYGFIQGAKLVAGIIASSDNGLILKNVANYGLITSQTSAGGIGCHLGSETSIDHAENFGEITGKDYTAGIASYFGYGYCTANRKYGTLKRAKNDAPIQGNKYTSGIVGKAQCVTIETSVNNGIINGKNLTGGICGHCQRSTTTSIYNTARISGTLNVGGITGHNEEGVTSSAYSTGKVDGDSLVGLMIGYNYNTTMADYYYLEQGDQEPFGLNNGGGVATPKSADEMKSSDFAELLGEDFVYDSGLNDGYPILNWEQEE
jgi:hypothetical protein